MNKYNTILLATIFLLIGCGAKQKDKDKETVMGKTNLEQDRAIHTTLVYWEDTKESFDKIDYWDNLIQSNSDILVHVKKSSDILEAKKTNKDRKSVV